MGLSIYQSRLSGSYPLPSARRARTICRAGKCDAGFIPQWCVSVFQISQESVYNLFVCGQSGQLPYLTHGITAITSFPSIVSYVSRLRRQNDLNEDEDLADRSDQADLVPAAQRNAWIAYIQAQVGDILASTL